MTRIHFHVTIFNSFDKPFDAKGLPSRGTSTIQLYSLLTLYAINPLNSTSDWSVTSLGKIHILSSQ